MKKQTQGKIEIILSMLIFGTIGVFVKNIALPSAEIALYRSAISFIVIFFLLIATKKISKLKTLKKDIIKLIASGTALGFNWVFLFEAYKHTTVALSTLCYYFAPTLVILSSLIFLKEKLNVKQILCFLGSSVGLLLIIGISASENGDVIGIVYGLLSALFYSTVVMINKTTGDTDGLCKTFAQFGASAVVMLIYVLCTCGVSIPSIDKNSLFNLIIIGIIHTGLTYFIYFDSLSKISGQQAAILSYIDPVVAVLCSLTVLNENINVYQTIGGIMIIAFAVLNEVKLKSSVKD